jgi:hypothetical protein
MVRIPQRLRQLLREVMAKYHPEMLPQFPPSGELALGQQQREPLRISLASELCESGFKPDDEPNDRGHALEELIDLVGKA